MHGLSVTALTLSSLQHQHQIGRTEEASLVSPLCGKIAERDREVSLADTRRNRHTLLSCHVQSSFTIDGIRYSARRCSRSAATAGRAAREAWCVCCRTTPGLWCRSG